MNAPLVELVERVTSETVYDKTGREIMRGDIVKVFHFTAARYRKRHFMYKQCLGIKRLPKSGGALMMFSHLSMTDEAYHEWADGRHLPGYEIVQSIDARFSDRPRVRALSSQEASK